MMHLNRLVRLFSMGVLMASMPITHAADDPIDLQALVDAAVAVGSTEADDYPVFVTDAAL